MRLVRVFVHRSERGNCNLRLRRTPADKILNPCHFGIIVGSTNVFFTDVVGIVVAVNAYVLDGFAQLSTVSSGPGITIDPTAVDPPRDRYRFYVVTQATMLGCGWFAGTASRGRYEALLHSGALVAVAYVVFTGAGMV